MKNTRILFTAITTGLFLAIGTSAQAQPGPGMGKGMGPVYSQQGQGQGQGMGPGNGQGRGRGCGFALNNDNTRGWSLMTPDERLAHRNRMFSAKTYDECKAIQSEHHKTMTERAKAQGKTLPTPRRNVCDHMKARGILK